MHLPFATAATAFFTPLQQHAMRLIHCRLPVTMGTTALMRSAQVANWSQFTSALSGDLAFAGRHDVLQSACLRMPERENLCILWAHGDDVQPMQVCLQVWCAVSHQVDSASIPTGSKSGTQGSRLVSVDASWKTTS